jgi:hypothetical protein
MPRAYIEMILSSKPVKRVWPLPMSVILSMAVYTVQFIPSDRLFLFGGSADAVSLLRKSED